MKTVFFLIEARVNNYNLEASFSRYTEYIAYNINLNSGNTENTGFFTTDGRAIKTDGSNASPLLLTDRSSTIDPSIGFIFEF